MTIHTVQRGDSIYSIAREYGVPPTRLIQDNLLENPSQLVVGQDLLILYPIKTHTVRGGETLDYIVTLYATDLNTIYRNNPNLSGEGNIYPGQVLNIAYEEPTLGTLTSLGYAYPNIDRSTLRRTLPYLTYLSVFSYGIRADGTLIEPEGGVDEVIALSKNYGTVPLLTLTSLNESGRFSTERVTEVLSNPELRASVIDSLSQTISAKGYGGVDVDFEYVPADLADEYAVFIQAIKAALGNELMVMVALAPKNQRDQRGLLYEGLDYASLGGAADMALLMTYEWGYAYGPPLPISPINEVRRVIDYAIQEIEPAKLLVGIPNYAYDWALPFVRGESRAETLSVAEAVERAREKQSAIEYDETAQAPFYRYYDRPASLSDAVEHVVWFQNARSADAMLRLSEEYGLAGTGVWNTMEYFPALWSIMNQLYRIEKQS